MQAILTCCCGVDVHKDMIEACIVKGMDSPDFLRKGFSTKPKDLRKFASWLVENECWHVAMESTGVYWRPVYEAIEARREYSWSIVVTNAHHMKNLPGRKSDVKDAEWIATLLQHGLLSASFIPARDIRDLRELSRSYKTCVSENVRYKNRLEKFLQTHGFKLSSVLSDICGVTGTHILTQLGEKGQLSLEDISRSMRGRNRHTAEEIYDAVCVSLNQAEGFLLTDIMDEIAHIKRHTERILAQMSELCKPYLAIIEQLTSIPGIDTTAAMLILGEIGATPTANFKTSRHLVSWAGLSPRNDESAGKLKSKKILPGNPYLKAILVQCAWGAAKSRHSPYKDWFWSRQGRLGKKKVIIAVARKMLTLIYAMLANGTMFDPNYSTLKNATDF